MARLSSSGAAVERATAADAPDFAGLRTVLSSDFPMSCSLVVEKVTDLPRSSLPPPKGGSSCRNERPPSLGSRGAPLSAAGDQGRQGAEPTGSAAAEKHAVGGGVPVQRRGPFRDAAHENRRFGSLEQRPLLLVARRPQHEKQGLVTERQPLFAKGLLAGLPGGVDVGKRRFLSLKPQLERLVHGHGDHHDE